MVIDIPGTRGAVVADVVRNTNLATVLVVDDDESFRLSVEEGLARYGDRFTVSTASDGVEALKSIEASPPSLVVSDIRMPIMGGIELLITCRKRFPQVPVVLLSAFFTEELERSAKSAGAAGIVHKPVDLAELVRTITSILDETTKGPASEGFLSGFSLAGFLQLLVLDQKSCALELRASDGKHGRIWLKEGRLIDAVLDDLPPYGAAMEILSWQEPDITMCKSMEQRPVQIHQDVQFLLMEAARIHDEKDHENQEVEADPFEQMIDGMGGDQYDDVLGSFDQIEVKEPVESSTGDVRLQNQKALFEAEVPSADEPATEPVEPSAMLAPTDTKPESDKVERPEVDMSSIQDILSKLRNITGFVAAGAFAPDGELIAEISSAGISLAELGALANDVLLKAQKSTDIMGVGRGNMVHVVAPRANILVRCLNENTDFAANEPGRAHLHCVLVLEADGNLAMGKMQLEKITQEVAPYLR